LWAMFVLLAFIHCCGLFTSLPRAATRTHTHTTAPLVCSLESGRLPLQSPQIWRSPAVHVNTVEPWSKCQYAIRPRQCFYVREIQPIFSRPVAMLPAINPLKHKFRLHSI
jgi:hypothetical protein